MDFPTLDLKRGKKYVFMCYEGSEQKIHGPDNGYLVVTYDPANPAGPLTRADPGVALSQLIAQRKITLPPAPAGLSPQPPVEQLLGVPTWFWTTDPLWRQKTLTVDAAGITAQLVLTAKAHNALEFRPDDGSAPVFCDAPGIPYNGQDDDASACTHTYTTTPPGGTYHAALVIHYDVRWQATGFPGGDLPDLETQPAGLTIPVKGTQSVGRNPTR